MYGARIGVTFTTTYISDIAVELPFVLVINLHNSVILLDKVEFSFIFITMLEGLLCFLIIHIINIFQVFRFPTMFPDFEALSKLEPGEVE